MNSWLGWYSSGGYNYTRLEHVSIAQHNVVIFAIIISMHSHLSKPHCLDPSTSKCFQRFSVFTSYKMLRNFLHFSRSCQVCVPVTPRQRVFSTCMCSAYMSFPDPSYLLLWYEFSLGNSQFLSYFLPSVLFRQALHFHAKYLSNDVCYQIFFCTYWQWQVTDVYRLNLKTLPTSQTPKFNCHLSIIVEATLLL